jgi:ketosteroid isomerase-like protein
MIARSGLDTVAALETRLKKLEDREAVWAVLMDYRRYLNARDFRSYARLFAEDGEWHGLLGHATGPAEIEALLERTMKRIEPHRQTVHLVCNDVIAVDGDRATAESTWCYLERDGDDNPVVSMIGRYDDVLERTEGSWKFRSRVCSFDIPFRLLEST